MGSSFAKELAELGKEIEETERLANRAWEASGLPREQWAMLCQADRQEGGRLHVRNPELVPVARALTKAELGEYVPPLNLGDRAYFVINDDGRAKTGL